MNDKEISAHIDALIGEEHALLERGERAMLDARERARLDELGVQLDRYWDLLRQRRARRGAGQDPEEAQMRSAQTVERYRQ